MDLGGVRGQGESWGGEEGFEVGSLIWIGRRWGDLGGGVGKEDGVKGVGKEDEKGEERRREVEESGGGCG